MHKRGKGRPVGKMIKTQLLGALCVRQGDEAGESVGARPHSVQHGKAEPTSDLNLMTPCHTSQFLPGSLAPSGHHSSLATAAVAAHGGTRDASSSHHCWLPMLPPPLLLLPLLLAAAAPCYSCMLVP